MTPIKPEDRPKVIALLAAIVAVFGFGAYRLVMANAGSESTTAAATPAAPSAPIAPPAATGAGSPSGYAASQPIVGPSADQNPFRSVIPRGGPSAPAPPAARPEGRPGGAVSINEGRSPVRGGRPGSGAASPLFPPGAGGTIPPALVGPAQPQPMELVGVVSGSTSSTSVAMIRAGEREHFVRVGDRVQGYRVTAIGTDQVTLRQGDQVRTLSVGFPAAGARPRSAPTPGNLPAAAPAATEEPLPGGASARPPRPAATATLR